MRLRFYIAPFLFFSLCGCAINPRFSKLPPAEREALTPLTASAEQLTARMKTGLANEPVASSAKDIAIYKIDSDFVKEYIKKSEYEFTHLYIYGTFCRPCVAEMPAVLQMQRSNRLGFIMVSPESFGELDRLKEFLYRSNIFYPTYILDLDKYGDAYNGIARYHKFVQEIHPGHPEISGFPTHMILNKEQKVLFAVSGANKFNQSVIDSVLRANR